LDSFLEVITIKVKEVISHAIAREPTAYTRHIYIYIYSIYMPCNVRWIQGLTSQISIINNHQCLDA
jgi:hypothetical protein